MINESDLAHFIGTNNYYKTMMGLYFTDGVKFIVFECDLNPTQYAKLRQRLSKVIKPDTDSIRFYFLCACCQGKVERIGGEMPRDESIFFA